MRVHQQIMTTSILLLCTVSWPGEVRAQAPTDQELLRRIDALEAELADLKNLVRARSAEQTPKAEAVESATKPEGALADLMHDVVYGGGLDLYYGFNFNRPVGRVNLLRAYDVTSNNFSLNQASLLMESAPDLSEGRRFGGRLDLQYGQATETLQGSLASEPRPWVYRNIFQAYGTYIFPLGQGLTVDFGKWASAIGLEGNYTKDQANYSRSYWFDYLPFYHMGVRATYRFNDTVAANYWLTNGTQQTEAFNNYKDQLFGAVINPAKSLTWTTNFYMGQEHPDVQPILTPGEPTSATQAGLSITPIIPAMDGRLHIFDSYATWAGASEHLLLTRRRLRCQPGVERARSRSFDDAFPRLRRRHLRAAADRAESGGRRPRRVSPRRRRAVQRRDPVVEGGDGYLLDVQGRRRISDAGRVAAGFFKRAVLPHL